MFAYGYSVILDTADNVHPFHPVIPDTITLLGVRRGPKIYLSATKASKRDCFRKNTQTRIDSEVR